MICVTKKQKNILISHLEFGVREAALAVECLRTLGFHPLCLLTSQNEINAGNPRGSDPRVRISTPSLIS